MNNDIVFAGVFVFYFAGALLLSFGFLFATSAEFRRASIEDWRRG